MSVEPMTVEWAVRALAAGALLGLAAFAASSVAGCLRAPRRWAWAAAMAGSLVLPALALAAPGALPDLRLPVNVDRVIDRGNRGSVDGSSAPGDADRDEMVGSTAIESAPRPLPRGFAIGWAAASLAMLGALAWSYARIRGLRDGCLARRVGDDGWALVSEDAGPMVVGLLHPRIVLPRWVMEAPPEERALVVRHEREHVRGGDPWLLALATLAVAAMPWNPALWWQLRRLRRAVETDCDARVLAGRVDRRLYGHVLLRAAAHPSSIPALALAWGERISDLEHRIVAIAAAPPRRPLPRAALAGTAALALAAAACGLAAPAETPPAGLPAGPATTMTWRLPEGDMLVLASPRVDAPPTPETGTATFVPGLYPAGQYPVVARVDPSSAAWREGFRPGDVILAVNGRDARYDAASGEDARRRLLGDATPLSSTVRVARGPAVMELSLVIGY